MHGGRIAEELKESADALAEAIVDSYRRIGASEAWLNLPPGLDQDHLPELIRSLVVATLETDFRMPECRELVRMAALHGQDRRDDGLEEGLLFTEYHLLRRTLWELLTETFGEGSDVFDATIKLDEGLGLCTAASLHGYHRREFEEADRWPGVLEALLEGWPGSIGH